VLRKLAYTHVTIGYTSQPVRAYLQIYLDQCRLGFGFL
jgi:hypothetical protein